MRTAVNLLTSIALVLLLASALATGAPAPHPPGGAQADPGQVVVTVTTLDGSVHLPDVQVELRVAAGGAVIARTMTDGAGRVRFPDVPAGVYVAVTSRPGFVQRESMPFFVGRGDTARVLLDTRLTFDLPEVRVRADSPSPTDSVQPVSMSDMLSPSLFQTAPIEGDDFQSLLPLLPGVVRDADGRLRIKGGQAAQGGLQISSASLIDPSSGDFDLDLPAPSVESVEVLPNPFAAEYGRFSSSMTTIRTRRGTSAWEVSSGNLIPRFRGVLRSVRGFEPRLSVRGPLKRDRLFLAQDVQLRYVATPVKSLPGDPQITLRSFDSFTRLDGVLSARHSLGGAVILFPRKVSHVTMNTFRPIGATPDFSQNGWAVGAVDRLALLPNVAVETTLSARRFEIEVNAARNEPMVYAPDSQSGGFFNDQERHVTSVQWVEALSVARNLWRGQHVFKFGTDLQASDFHGTSLSRPVEIRRLDGTLAERIDFGGPTSQRVRGLELTAFAQDRWRVSSRIAVEVGGRLDRDAVVERVNWSPRAGVAIAVLPQRSAIVRGGFGKFVQRTPLNVGAFPTFESRTVTRYDAAGLMLAPAGRLANSIDGPLHTPEALVGNLEWDQRFGRRVFVKVSGLQRAGAHEYIVSPDAAAGRLRLSSTGHSRYRELEATTRYVARQRDVTVSYVWARGTADLNNYDQFYGNLRNPIVRANEHNLIPTDVRHRLLLRGTIGIPGRWDLAPVLELRSGFPWSAVDEYLDFRGPRGRAGRLPMVHTLDIAASRPWQLRKYRFRAGLRAYNVFGAAAERDIQTSLASPLLGTAYNPVDRSIGFVLSSSR